MNALKSLAVGLAATLSLGSPTPVGAAPGGGFHGSAPAFHGSSGSHAPAASFHTAPHASSAPRAFPGPRNSTVRSSAGSVSAPTFAFGGHPADPRSGAATTAARHSNRGFDRPTNGWNPHWDRIWHGHHYHWNDGAWVIINDGYYPWEDSYYAPASPDVYPDMSYDYGDTPSDAGAPNPAPNTPAVAAAPQEDSIAADVQQSLASRGYYDGQIDGVVGDTTRGAIAEFQKDNNLPVTGYITKSLLNALGL